MLWPKEPADDDVVNEKTGLILQDYTSPGDRVILNEEMDLLGAAALAAANCKFRAATSQILASRVAACKTTRSDTAKTT
ncbi:hypothetical protein NPX13_g9662 [Xylaria arbuscula]|uniref:Uncharacterized protein n=1 Tax=Xylaria arbuscula TaxID=114810 RepID=A0A9W8N6C9_9PEZI|nr:hypothetical protein NPX13_g9662 [Xylaria arbuscula]